MAEDDTTASLLETLARLTRDRGVELVAEMGPRAYGIADELLRKLVALYRKSAPLDASKFEGDPDTGWDRFADFIRRLLADGGVLANELAEDMARLQQEAVDFAGRGEPAGSGFAG